MRKDMEKVINSCLRCQVNKAYRQVTSAPLQFMPIPKCLSKMAHFIPLKQLLSFSLRESSRYMDFPRSLPRIVIQNSVLSSGCLCSTLWKRSCDSGQVFIQIRIDKQNVSTTLLRLCWATAFEYWDQVPSHAWIGLQLGKTLWSWNVAIITSLWKKPGFTTIYCSLYRWISSRRYLDLVQFSLCCLSWWKDCLYFAQAQQPKFHNEYRSSRYFNPGDVVFLRRNPMRKMPKLETCWIGCSQVEYKHSPVPCRLKLTPGSRIHPVVYVAWMQPYYACDALARVWWTIVTSLNTKLLRRLWKRKLRNKALDTCEVEALSWSW